jgi:hypothetical protein
MCARVRIVLLLLNHYATAILVLVNQAHECRQNRMYSTCLLDAPYHFMRRYRCCRHFARYHVLLDGRRRRRCRCRCRRCFGDVGW